MTDELTMKLKPDNISGALPGGQLPAATAAFAPTFATLALDETATATKSSGRFAKLEELSNNVSFNTTSDPSASVS